MKMSGVYLYVWILALTWCVPNAEGYITEGSLYCSEQQCKFKADVIDKDATAYGSYNDTVLQTGWGILDVVSGYGPVVSDNDVMYAAGYLEGVLTAPRIYQNYKNVKAMFAQFEPASFFIKLSKFFDTQDSWMRAQIQDNPKDPFWRHVGFIVQQYDGLYSGYKSVIPSNQSIGIFGLQLLNGCGDMLDLTNVLEPGSRPNWWAMPPEEAKRRIFQNGHCSALIKVLPGYENIYMSQVSWFAYAATLRIFKHYSFNVRDPMTSSKSLSFSSYPGMLESLDDFYVMGNGLVMLQTTNAIFNTSLYDLVHPQSLLAWHRVRVANMMAQNGKQWADTLAKYNSGTYNNQYMVLDKTLFKAKVSLDDNALWLVEQTPGLVEAADVTNVLREGYWPSYNVPYFETIYNRSGYPGAVARWGIDVSYQLAPRAKIFRRDANKVTDMASMKGLMRSNDYKHDPYSEDNPYDAICSRGDLTTKSPSPSGCYDAKVTDIGLINTRTAWIISGPTLGTKAQLKPFSWSQFPDVLHDGLPKMYNFSFELTSPKWQN